MILVKNSMGGKEFNMINTVSKINLSKIGWVVGGSTSIWIMSLNILFFWTLPLRRQLSKGQLSEDNDTCSCLLGQKSPWTKVSWDNCHLGQKSPLGYYLLGQRSLWPTVTLDKSSLDNCHPGQLHLGRLLQHPLPHVLSVVF